MDGLSRVRAHVGAVPRFFVRQARRRFLESVRDCRTAQHRTLSRLLDLNADSRFSRAHRLSGGTSPGLFRRRLPIADYEQFRPHVERLKIGDVRALLGSRNPLLMFTLSSGTTGDAKFIPITAPFLADYRTGWQIWGIGVLDDHPLLNRLNIVQLSSHYDRFRTPGGTPCGNISGLVSAVQKRIVQTMYTVPRAVAEIPDPDARLYTAVRLAVADAHVGWVITANPSTLIQLARLADEKRVSLIRDIAERTLSADVPESIRYRLKRRLNRGGPRRAAELSRSFEQSGRFFPRDYWKHLQVVAVWTGGSAGAYLPTVREYFGDVTIRDHGLSASEGRMTVPLVDGCPAGVLEVNSHFFEFIPAEEYNSPQPIVLEAHELERDHEYYILLTTASGLYRYDICDVVRCVGFFGTTPMLTFRHKGAHISNLTGEKLSESHVISAVTTAAQLWGQSIGEFTVCPLWGDPPGYGLFLESPGVVNSIETSFLDCIDRELSRHNCEYREKRQSGRLGPLTLHIVPTGTWQALARQRQARLGGSFEQYKHPCLVPQLGFANTLASLDAA